MFSLRYLVVQKGDSSHDFSTEEALLILYSTTAPPLLLLHQNLDVGVTNRSSASVTRAPTLEIISISLTWIIFLKPPFFLMAKASSILPPAVGVSSSIYSRILGTTLRAASLRNPKYELRSRDQFCGVWRNCIGSWVSFGKMN
ncbi:PREDICTED: uncharacterized protein LOC104759485 [Camelina sativa]|uniref:Uncharacterized protein LOC104759485 n=1 Tax=Camelina sativa TaxID=90675 RepID=A0ABM1R7F4_CAMSA|nr:PREDICTED: uncharacterized protein LOC104759485 [Camelina sativa]